MVSTFGYGNHWIITESSATSESMFKDLKSIVFKHKTLPIRLNEFFIMHVESNIGSMSLTNTSVQSKVDTSGFQRETKRSISEIQGESKPLVSNIHDKSERPFSNIRLRKENIYFKHSKRTLTKYFGFYRKLGLGKPENKTKKIQVCNKGPNNTASQR